jgi:hypothetical protein
MEAFVLPLCFSPDFLQIQTPEPVGAERLSTVCTFDLNQLSWDLLRSVV